MNYSLMYSTNDTFNITDYNLASAYYNETAHTSEIRNVTIDISGSTEPRAVTLQKGDVGISGGRIKLSGTKPRGISQAKDTFAIENVNMTVIGTGNSYVFFNDEGLLKVLSGSYIVEGDNAYGIYNDTGTIEVGVEGGGVSTTDPLIKATGTTTGIGISNVNGTFKYYDGKIMGTTGFKGENDITNGIEDAYQVKSYTEVDSETGIEYKYCILEIMM